MSAKPTITYEFGQFRLELSDHSLLKNGRPIPLTPKAFEVLVCLIERQGHLVKKDELMQEVWADSFVEEGNVSRTIWMLRTALGDGVNNHKFIQTVPKLGYRFAAEVNVIEGQFPATIAGSEANGRPIGLTNEINELKQINSAEVENVNVKTAHIKPLWTRRSVAVMLASATLLIGLVVFGAYFWKASPTGEYPITSIAILPFDNLSGDPAQDAFAEGLTETLITELGKINVLRVIDRGSTNKYKASQKTISEIAQALNVGAVAKGSAVREGDHVRITIQLYRGASGQNLWSEIYDRELGDALVMQSSVARAVANVLRMKLSQRDQEMLSDGHSINPEAQDAFLEALDNFNTARNMTDGDARFETFRKSAESLEKAVAIEPDYATAYAKLASSYVYMAGFKGSPDLWAKATANAKQTLELDPLNAQAHASLAVVAFRFSMDRETAEREFTTAIDLAPSTGDGGLGAYALFLSSEGRQDEAIATMKRSIEVDPFSTGMKMNVGNFLTRSKKYDLAIEYLKRIEESNPAHSGTHMALSKALAMKGSFDEAITEANKGVQISGTSADKLKLAWIYARSGNRDEASNILHTVVSSEATDDGTRAAYDTATVYSELGDIDKAFSWLERALAGHSQAIVWLKVDPEFEGIRGDPRYKNLLKKIGLST